MGLNIKEIVPRRELDLSELKGKILCVDAYNMIYQFLTTIRQPDGTPLMDTKRRITSHLSGIFYRNANLILEGVRLIYVFDGEPPYLKSQTLKIRDEIRYTNKEKYALAQELGDTEKMRRYSANLIRLDEDMIKESKELLEAMGIQTVQAPSEGEAEAAYLTKINSKIYATVSQDYDSLLFGTPRLIRNLGLSRKRKTLSGWVDIKPELIELNHMLNVLDINLDQLICLGILIGTDYNPRGILGIGQKKALEIVKKYKQPVLIFRNVEEKIMSLPEEDRFDWTEIFELFKKPNVINVEIKDMDIDAVKIKKILIQEHDFSEERISKYVDKLLEFQKKTKQKNLERWL